jgi:2,3-bisphosphoglycerate-dependent phosphoglycerate mutase
MEIILIRHGVSLMNEANTPEYKICSGQYDSPLTSKGIEQAKKLNGDPLLADVDAIYSSDLYRCKQTCSYIFPDREAVYDARLRERYLGEFEGKYIQDLAAKAEYKKYFTDPEFMGYRHSFKVSAPGGESYKDVENRARSFLDEVLETGSKKIVIISHTHTMRCILKVLKDLSEEETLKLKINNCEPVIVEK